MSYDYSKGKVDPREILEKRVESMKVARAAAEKNNIPEDEKQQYIETYARNWSAGKRDASRDRPAIRRDPVYLESYAKTKRLMLIL